MALTPIVDRQRRRPPASRAGRTAGAALFRLARVLPLACFVATALPEAAAAQDATDARDTLAVRDGRQAGWLGIRIDVRAPILGTPEDSIAVVVADVYPGGPADIGGVLPGDRVLAVDSAVFTGWGTWIRFAAEIPPGRVVRLRLRRNGAVQEATVVAGDPPSAVVGFAPDRFASDERARHEFAAIQVRLLRTMDSLLRVATSPTGQVGRSWTRTRSFDLLGDLHGTARRADSLTQAAIRRVGEEVRSSQERLRITEDGYATPAEAEGGGGPALRPVRSEGSWRVRLMTSALLDNPFVFGGALARNLTTELGRYFDNAAGVLLTDVLPRTPAAAAGFQPGDVIVAAAGRETPTLATLRTVLAETGPPYEIVVVRRGARATVWYPPRVPAGPGTR